MFLAAYRARSLGAAAVRLGVDTSTVSRRLTTLEASAGLRLFDRSREGLSATHAAQSMLAAAETMEAAHAQLARDASEGTERVEGTVRVSVAPGMADVFVAPLLVDLRARHPRLTIELDASVRASDLTHGEADLALRSISPAGADIVMRKLTRAPWVAAGSPALVKTLGKLRSWTAAPWVAWDHDLASMHVARWLAEHVPKADVALRTSHFTSQLVALETGLAIGLIAEPYLAARGLLPVRIGRELVADARAWPVDDLWIVGHRALRECRAWPPCGPSSSTISRCARPPRGELRGRGTPTALATGHTRNEAARFESWNKRRGNLAPDAFSTTRESQRFVGGAHAPPTA